MDSFLKKENRFPCPPDMSNIRQSLKEVANEYDDWEIKNANKIISCVEDYLNLYNVLATGNPPEDNLVKDIYYKTVKMLDEAEKSVVHKKNLVLDKIDYYEDEFVNFCENANEEMTSYCKEVKDAIDSGYRILNFTDDDLKTLKNLKEYCNKTKNNLEMILCVEKFVNTTHVRGSYISLGCGGRFSEILSSTIEEDEEIPLVEKVTPIVETETQKVLNCLKDYKP